MPTLSKADKIFNKQFGELVRDKRKELNYSQERMAKKLKIARTSLTNIELGYQKTSMITFLKMIDLKMFTIESVLFNTRIIE